MDRETYMAKWHPDALLDFMERGLYFDWDGTPVDRERYVEIWMGDRHVAVTDLGRRGRVSTVFMAMDMGVGFGGMPPLLYETMIFGGPKDGFSHRYFTKEHAAAGHAIVVRRLRRVPCPPLIHNGGRPRG